MTSLSFFARTMVLRSICHRSRLRYPADLLELLVDQDRLDQRLESRKNAVPVLLLPEMDVRVPLRDAKRFRNGLPELGEGDRLVVHHRDDAVDGPGADRRREGGEKQRERQHLEERGSVHFRSSESSARIPSRTFTSSLPTSPSSHFRNSSSLRRSSRSLRISGSFSA